MSKLAVVTALTVAMGLGGLSQAYAQGNTSGGASSSKMQTGMPTGFSAAQTSTATTEVPGKMPGSWQTNPTTGIGTFIPAGQQAPAATSTTTSTSTSTSSSTTTAAPASTATSTQTTTQTTTLNGKTMVIPPPPSKGGTAAPAGSATKKGETFTLQVSPVNVARKAGWQRYQNSVSLTTGQDQLTPLNLTLTNSFFTKINLSLAGRPVATEKDFKNNVLSLNLAGALTDGQNQLIIQGYGPVGAKITWVLSTAKPTVANVNPKEIKVGEKFTVSGTNFSKTASLDQVWIGRKQAAVVSATKGSIVATVPQNAEAGDQNLIVRITGMETKPFKVKIKKNPILDHLSQNFVAPGESFVIYGSGLEGKQIDVHMGGLLCQVVSSDDNSITVIAPADSSNLWNVPDMTAGPMWPITVTVDGTPAGGEKLTIEAHNV